MVKVSNIIGRCLGDLYRPLKLIKRGGNHLRLGTKHLQYIFSNLFRITLIILIFISCDLIKKDKEPPYVEIISPKDSSLFSGGLKVELLVIDSSKINNVSLYLDNNLFDIDTSYPYEFYIKFPTPFTWHKIFAKAYDIYKNEGTSKEIRVFYLGKRKENIYHGEVYINSNSEYKIDFFANLNDSIIGEILVKNGDTLAMFLFLNENNDTILKLQNFNYEKIEREINKTGKYYLVWKNISLERKRIWIRFYLARD